MTSSSSNRLRAGVLGMPGFTAYMGLLDIGQPKPGETVTPWVAEGKVKYREDVVQGLERAPEALIGMLERKNFGKVVVQVE